MTKKLRASGSRKLPERAPQIFWLLAASCISLVFLQRLAIPVGSLQFPVTEVAILGVVAYAVRNQSVEVSSLLTLAYIIIILSTALVTLLQVMAELPIHVSSVVFLWVLYAPLCIKTKHQDIESYFKFARFYTTLMVFVAAFSSTLFCLQFAGLAYNDWLGSLVPTQFLTRGYVTSYPITFDSEIYRNSGVFFLEPSALSAFIGIAYVCGMFTGARVWKLLILSICLITTVSGNGFVVIFGAIIASIVSRHGRKVGKGTAVLILCLAVGWLTPVGTALVTRVGEGSDPSSSLSLRTIVPYQTFIPKLLAGGPRLWLGWGPGSINDAVKFDGLIYPILVKAPYEYGAFVAILIIGFIISSVIRKPWAPLSFGVLLIFLVLDADMLSTVLVGQLLLFCAWWPDFRTADNAK